MVDFIGVPRCFKSTNLDGKLIYKLHHFADASKLAYGAVSYLCIEDERGNVHCFFVIGKGHLAPTSVTIIPRLELLAAVCALQLDEMLRRELEFPIGNLTSGQTRPPCCRVFITVAKSFLCSWLTVWQRSKERAKSHCVALCSDRN